MNGTVHGATVARPARDWLGLAIGTILVIAAGVVFGMQYVQPDKRMLGVLAAALVVGVSWRLDMVSALGLLVLALPYPRGTTFGNTNFALILLLLVIWLMRATHRAAPMPQRTPADLPVVGLVIAYILSFYNIASRTDLFVGFANTLVFLAGVAMFYLIVNNVRTEHDLQRLHRFQAISIASVALLSLYELYRPGAVVIPGWIRFGTPEQSEGVRLHDVRIGGPFTDFELLAEYAAMMLVLVLFLWWRSRSRASGVTYAALFGALAVVLFATVTRGAMVALGAGTLYMLWLLRRRIRFVPLVIAVAVAVVGVQALNYFVAHYTSAGDLLGRLADPQSRRFVGWMPEARADLWMRAFDRMMMHPILGHGPHYALQIGVRTYYWPHNGYLYIGNLLGFTGLTFYLLLLWKLFRLSRVPSPSLSDPSYARAFLTAGRVQLAIFAIDQMKIDYLRNPMYTFQVWLMIASIVAAAGIVARRSEAPVAPP
jgi:O-antigen ligase